MNIPVIYEDEWLLIVNKPAGLLTIPSPRREKRTLTSILNDEAVRVGSPVRIYPCHRLDRETSGVIIFAKGKSVQKRMMEIFKSRLIRKKYTAFASGSMSRRSGLINSRVDGKGAVTRYQLMRRLRDFSVVDVEPETGRKNQIRIHFKRIGHPLLGESRFALRRDFTLKMRRVCLHARSISFLHPYRKTPLCVEAPLSEDMQVLLTRLG